MAKHIFVTGGVVSSLGKGITAASLGLLLKHHGLKVAMQKFDPYLNVDPGTMNPYQHGETYVTKDGAETDLDLGHYERFTGIETTRNSNYTSGRIYSSVIAKERRGDYLGGTVQVVPHVTDEIKNAVRSITDGVDVVITELGGTVGDIEGLPFLEAIRQFGLEEGRGNVIFIHVTLIVNVTAAGERKTKPTQHSVQKLREIGIVPDFLVCRCDDKLDEEMLRKLSLFTNVEADCVIEEPDVADTIFEVPFQFLDQKFDESVINKLGLEAGEIDMSKWKDIIHRIRNPKGEISVAVVGKYGELQDAYKSIYEALDHGGIANEVKVNTRRVLAEDVEEHGVEKYLSDVDAILIPGGFGSRGTEGKIMACKYARENKIPFLGLCLGMQTAAIEFARNVCGLEGANSTENDPETPHPVIYIMEDQKDITDKGATMRLGNWPCKLVAGTKAHDAYGCDDVLERHRHRYEFNNKYKQTFEENGVIFSGLNPEKDIVEIIELKDHPWFVATQAHPEFRSTPIDPHPLFLKLVENAKACKKK